MVTAEVRPIPRQVVVFGAAALVVLAAGLVVIQRGPFDAVVDRVGGSFLGHMELMLLLALLTPVALAVAARPQLGLLLLALLVPYRGLLAILPAPPFAEGFKEAITLYTLAWALLGVVGRTREWARKPNFVAPLLMYFVVGAVSALRIRGTTGLVGLKVGFLYALILVICWLCPLSRRERDWLVTIFMVNGFITAAVGLWQQVVGGQHLVDLGYEWNVQVRTIGGWLRSFSTFNQPFPFGFFLTLVILVGLPVSLSDLGRLRSKFFLLSLPVLLGGLVVSFVRGAWLGLAIGLVYLAFHRHRAMLFAAPIVILSLMFLPGSFSTRAFSDESLGERQVGWTENLGQVFSAPLGNGIGTTGAAAEKAIEVKRAFAVFYQPDNQYFKVVYELGVPGLWFFFLVLVFGFSYVRSVEARSDGFDRALLAGISANVLGVIGACFIATYFEIFPMEAFFWLLLGVASSCDRESS